MRADADAGIGDDEVRGAEAIDEVLRSSLGGLRVGDIQRIGDDRAGKRDRDRPARDQAEGRAG